MLRNPVLPGASAQHVTRRLGEEEEKKNHTHLRQHHRDSDDAGDSSLKLRDAVDKWVQRVPAQRLDHVLHGMPLEPFFFFFLFLLSATAATSDLLGSAHGSLQGAPLAVNGGHGRLGLV